MNETVPSPITNRQMEQQREDLSPLSAETFQPTRCDVEATENNMDGTIQPVGLALSNTKAMPVTRRYVKIPSPRSKADSSRLIHRSSTQDMAGMMIYPSDMLVEAEASEEPTTPTYQKRGRFIVWPADFNSQDLSISLRNRV